MAMLEVQYLGHVFSQDELSLSTWNSFQKRKIDNPRHH